MDTALIDVDFTSGPEIFEKIKDRVKGKEIGVLVNNVGIAHSRNFFLSIPDREKMIQDIIRCNITSMPMMCSIVLPQMVERKRGVVINISSLSGVIPASNKILYSASKAFVNKFSQDLLAEYELQGIIVQTVLPGYVATQMVRSRTCFLIPSPKQFASAALSTVGFSGHTTGYLPHAGLMFSAQLLNYIAPSLSRSIIFKTMLNLRTSFVDTPATD